ncbi:hypothetical protein HNP92_000915 [Methanococcus maripaludis]|uniref:HD-CE domain-containing protein n=1 Tax=Methanococcus maripaludis TaxID=39152 RepID=A0A7J9S5M3_METMI|nr:ATP-binding protein [Methanococcus maripaludis]MBB6401610.1 hypothetical protein [Methanococcus maripaludis]
MGQYTKTKLWEDTLKKQPKYDDYEIHREFLRSEFEKIRENAKILAREISVALPDYTVHDIAHSDALWETSDLLTKNNFEITPAEAFVLGVAFLIHDLGMGIASFPNGLKKLKKEVIWKDTVASLLKAELGRPIKSDDFDNINPKIEKKATNYVLRHLHGKNAENLAKISWKNSSNQDMFLIENAELREAYGPIIGLISHSHCWNVEELENKLPTVKLGALGKFPSDWTVDSIKLACILRIADAMQIDDRRAPLFLRTIRNLPHSSEAHWNFQQKLYQPQIEKDLVYYTSKSSFSIDEVDSWWLCNDTLQMIDDEINDVNALLLATNHKMLNARGVASIETPQRLSNLITVEGWQPADTKIKVGNVAKLVSNLGGKQLYGDNAIVPLRELIQNASDAIRARRLLENENDDFGDISVTLGSDEHGHFIEIGDNGVGMSKKVLTGPFLDFGESFWGTSLMHDQLPGLESKGFYSTGQYGIGFFSVFMWGNKVSVTTKRFEKGRESTLIMEFNNGVDSRPILRNAKSNEIIKDGGTRVKIWFSDDNLLDNLLGDDDVPGGKISLKELLKSLCPSLDCNLYLIENENKELIIKANDWITIPPMDLISRLIGESYIKKLDENEKKLLEIASNHMTLIKDDDGTILGRLFIYQNTPGWDIFSYLQDDRIEHFIAEGAVTVGGITTSSLSHITGILIGRNERASRDIGIPKVSNDKIKDWASLQAKLLCNLDLETRKQTFLASIIRSVGGVTSKLKIVDCTEGPMDYDQLKLKIKKLNLDEIIIASTTDVYIYERDKKAKICLEKNVFCADSGIPTIMGISQIKGYIEWPNTKNKWFHSRSLNGLVIEAFADVWGYNVGEILQCSDISSDDKLYNAVVGTSGDEDVTFDDVDIIRLPKK